MAGLADASGKSGGGHPPPSSCRQTVGEWYERRALARQDAGSNPRQCFGGTWGHATGPGPGVDLPAGDRTWDRDEPHLPGHVTSRHVTRDRTPECPGYEQWTGLQLSLTRIYNPSFPRPPYSHCLPPPAAPRKRTLTNTTRAYNGHKALGSDSWKGGGIPSPPGASLE